MCRAKSRDKDPSNRKGGGTVLVGVVHSQRANGTSDCKKLILCSSLYVSMLVRLVHCTKLVSEGLSMVEPEVIVSLLYLGEEQSPKQSQGVGGQR